MSTIHHRRGAREYRPVGIGNGREGECSCIDLELLRLARLDLTQPHARISLRSQCTCPRIVRGASAACHVS